mmetsp:Transcript_10800/g.40379  ORF Transcript_10800/g.40379 Transcript_10800/m.40379 type:complete len:113 (+) Transcript_10800:3003-3341(+)
MLVKRKSQTHLEISHFSLPHYSIDRSLHTFNNIHLSRGMTTFDDPSSSNSYLSKLILTFLFAISVFITISIVVACFVYNLRRERQMQDKREFDDLAREFSVDSEEEEADVSL